MFSTVWLMFFSLGLSLFERLYSISITFGVNSQAYGVNSKGYGDNSKGYGDNSKGYGDNSKGLGDRNLPFYFPYP